MRKRLAFLPLALLLAACQPATKPGSDKNGLPSLEAGHIGVYGKLEGTRSGYQVLAASMSGPSLYQATVDSAGNFVVALPENSGRYALMAYHDGNANGFPDQGEFVLQGGYRPIFAYENNLTGWVYQCVATRLLTVNVTIPEEVLELSEELTVSASDPAGYQSSGPAVDLTGSDGTEIVQWEVPADRALYLDALAEGEEESGYALRTTPLQTSDSANVSMELQPYEEFEVSGEVSYPPDSSASDIGFLFSQFQGTRSVRHSSSGNVTETSAGAGTYTMTLSPGFYKAGAGLTETLIGSTAGWYGSSTTAPPNSFLIVSGDRDDVDISLVPVETVTLTFDYALPEDAPETLDTPLYSFSPDFPSTEYSWPAQVNTEAGTVSLVVPKAHPLEWLRLDWDEIHDPEAEDYESFYTIVSFSGSRSFTADTELGELRFTTY